MQIFYVDEVYMILSYIVLWPMIQLSLGFFLNRIPDEYFHSKTVLFKSRKFERDGKIYKRIFKINKWKRLLPDGAKAFKNGFQKKHIIEMKSEYIFAFIAETKRAELMHWLSILPFFIFGFWSPGFVVWIMLAYALLFNIPPIIAQRYNRPRLQKLYKRMKTKEKNYRLNL